MSNRYSRHQAVINRAKDAHIDDDYWFKQFEKNLEKSAVQSKRVDQELFHQMNSIMHNSKSKYTSVSAAVEDMMQRSGLTSYLNNIKVSEKENKKKKVASETPEIIKKYPELMNTVNNVIGEGNLNTPTIIAELQRIHSKDIDDDGLWDDPKFIQMITHLNLTKRKENIFDNNESSLGKRELSNDYDYDEANNDMFHSLNPAKI